MDYFVAIVRDPVIVPRNSQKRFVPNPCSCLGNERPGKFDLSTST